MTGDTINASRTAGAIITIVPTTGTRSATNASTASGTAAGMCSSVSVVMAMPPHKKQVMACPRMYANTIGRTCSSVRRSLRRCGGWANTISHSNARRPSMSR